MDKNHKHIITNDRGASATDHQVAYGEELGEENVELVDSEWADFERALRYFVIHQQLNISTDSIDLYLHNLQSMPFRLASDYYYYYLLVTNLLCITMSRQCLSLSPSLFFFFRSLILQRFP